MSYKQYSGDTSAYEKKLVRVMERLSVTEYRYDWTRTSCFVEMCYAGKTYRFENSVSKSEESGRNLRCLSDLFAQIVLSLEGLARAIENGIFSLDMLMAGVPALSAARTLPPCVVAMGFDHQPESAAEIKAQYRRMSKALHPDNKDTGSRAAFEALAENYKSCLEMLE